MKILIVEDHKKINQLLTNFLKQDDHSVKQSFCAEDALKQMEAANFDLIITDLMLPDMQGEELIEIVRKTSDIYIIVISAKTETEEKIDVLSLGADDYLTKPFSVEEVLIKIKNLSKRLNIKKPVIYSFNNGELAIYPMQRKVMLLGKDVDLTSHEYDLIHHLATHSTRVFSRNDLIISLF